MSTHAEDPRQRNVARTRSVARARVQTAGSEGAQDDCDGSIAQRKRRLQWTSGSGEGADNAEETQGG